MAYAMKGKVYILTSLDQCDLGSEELQGPDLETVRSRKGLKILDDLESATHPADRLVLNAWSGLNQEILTRIAIPKRNDVVMLANILRDEDERYKVWWAEFEPGEIRFQIVTREGKVVQETIGFKFSPSCHIDELRVVAQEVPEVVLAYRRSSTDKTQIIVGKVGKTVGALLV